MIIQSLKEAIAATIPDKRKQYKEFKTTYGKKAFDKATFGNCLDGGQNIATLFSQYTLFSVDNYQKQPKVLNDFLQSVQASSIHQKYQIESYLWYLFTNQLPTEQQIHIFLHDLSTRQAHMVTYAQEKNIFGQIKATAAQIRKEDNTKGLAPLLQASLTFLFYQPQSQFYAHRKETLKTAHWEIMLEDYLDIVSILPVVLYHLHYPTSLPPVSLPPVNNSHNHEPAENTDHTLISYTEQLYTAFTLPCAEEIAGYHDPKRYKQQTLPVLTHYLLHNMIGSGAYPHEYAPRLISCTLSDPYLAISGLCHSYGGWQNKRLVAANVPIQYTLNDAKLLPKGIEQLFWLKWSSCVLGNILEVWYDRMLMYPLANPKSVDYETVINMFPQSPHSDNNNDGDKK